PIGGKLARLDIEAARRAIAERIGAPLGLAPEDAAEAILKVANARMAGAIRLVSIERGHDPAKFAAMPFGGGGALHTGALIREVGLGSAIVPRYPGVTSALGCVVADMRLDRVQTVNRLLGELDPGALGREMQAVAETLAAELDRAGVDFVGKDRLFEFDMLYLGQTHTVRVPVEIGAGGLSAAAIREAFEAAYREAYGRLLEGIPMRVMNYRVAAIGRRPAFDMGLLAPRDGRPAADCRTATRQVYCNGQWLEAGVYDRLALAAGERIDGPALMEQPDATCFVDPGLSARVDRFGNLIIERSQG
ncbi:MAG: hydantoinase/oxoprolinase family protein, partial [Alphaproteobacteria bacterium]